MNTASRGTDALFRDAVTTRSWPGKALKALLSEVLIKGKCLPDSEAAHDVEAGTVNKTELATAGGQESLDGSSMIILFDPNGTYNRLDLFLQRSDCRYSQPVLKEGYGFKQDVIRANDISIARRQSFQSVKRMLMISVPVIKNGVEGRCIDENAHDSYASAR